MNPVNQSFFSSMYDRIFKSEPVKSVPALKSIPESYVDLTPDQKIPEEPTWAKKNPDEYNTFYSD